MSINPLLSLVVQNHGLKHYLFHFISINHVIFENIVCGVVIRKYTAQRLTSQEPRLECCFGDVCLPCCAVCLEYLYNKSLKK